MRNVGANQNKSALLGFLVFLVCLWLNVGVIPVAAESAATKKSSTASTQEDMGLSTDTLQEQITDLDGQIQKLREKSLQLQEKTRAKLQAQLEHFKKERDTLVPRIEKLRDNSELAWQDIKENIQKVIEDLNTSVDTIQ